MERKLISKFQFRSITASGDPAKTKCWVYNTGVIVVQVTILSTNQNYKDNFSKAYHRFGKILYVREMAFKYKSLSFIMSLAQKSFAEHGVNPDELL